MSKAYRCDACGEYEDRHPDEAPTLTAPETDEEGKWTEKNWYDLCRRCAVELEGMIVRGDLGDEDSAGNSGDRGE